MGTKNKEIDNICDDLDDVLIKHLKQGVDSKEALMAASFTVLKMIIGMQPTKEARLEQLEQFNIFAKTAISEERERS